MKYAPIDSTKIPRFSGIKTFMRLPYVETNKDIDFAVIGVPFDTGGSFAVGTRFGPEAIRSMSSLIRPYNPNLGLNIFDYCSGVDYGDFSVNPGYIEDSYELIANQLKPILDAEVIPVLIGGDHSVTLPHLRAMAKKYGQISLIHFDSHSDTNDSYFGKKYTHGTMFRRAVEEKVVDPNTSIQIGIRGSQYSSRDVDGARELGYTIVDAQMLKQTKASDLGKLIKETVNDNPVFVTFDIDFLDPVYAPGTGTPEIGGFTTSEAQQFIWQLKGLNIKGFDLVEVLPDRDPTKVTSIAAANILFEFLSLIAYKKKERLKVQSQNTL